MSAPVSVSTPGTPTGTGRTGIRRCGAFGRVCSVPGCGRAHLARGYCRPHYLRWQRRATPLPEVPIVARSRGSNSYAAALRRVRTLRGPASAQKCAECTGPAALWSYDGADLDERTDAARGTRYSLDPARYRPRCRFCHRRAVVQRSADLPGRPCPVPNLDVERAARLYRAGASARGIGSLLRVSPDAVLRTLRAHGVAIRPNRRQRTQRCAPPRERPQAQSNPHDEPASSPDRHDHQDPSAQHETKPPHLHTATRSRQARHERKELHDEHRNRELLNDQTAKRTNASRSDGGFREP
jgi:hypothetical protein